MNIERNDFVGSDLPFSRSTAYGDLVHVCGHVGFAPGTGDPIGDDVTEQTAETLRVIDEALAQAGSRKDHLLMVRVYLTRPQQDFAAMNAVYLDWIGAEHQPARTTIGVGLVHPGLLVEIDCVGVKVPG